MRLFLQIFTLWLGTSALCRAQAVASALPMDSVSQKVTYRGTIILAGASRADLYWRARQWLARDLGLPSQDLVLDSPERGELIANYHSVCDQHHFLLTRIPYDVRRTLTIRVEDGRIKYEMTNFTARNRTHSAQYGALESPDGFRLLSGYVQRVATAEISSLLRTMQSSSGS